MNNILFSSKDDTWSTPKWLFDLLNKHLHFDIDACASSFNKLCNEFYSLDNSILNKTFNNKTIFMNPPYSRKMGVFVQWCLDQSYNNNKIVLLVPSRTDTKWFHNCLHSLQCDFRFFKGRLKFGNGLNSAPFPSVLIFFNCDGEDLYNISKELETLNK